MGQMFRPEAACNPCNPEQVTPAWLWQPLLTCILASPWEMTGGHPKVVKATVTVLSTSLARSLSLSLHLSVCLLHLWPPAELPCLSHACVSLSLSLSVSVCLSLSLSLPSFLRGEVRVTDPHQGAPFSRKFVTEEALRLTGVFFTPTVGAIGTLSFFALLSLGQRAGAEPPPRAVRATLSNILRDGFGQNSKACAPLFKDALVSGLVPLCQTKYSEKERPTSFLTPLVLRTSATSTQRKLSTS